MTRKHLPTRTCIACRRIKPKQHLIRIVRNPDGNIELDKSGKANGRGGYLCKNILCWNRALKRRATLLKRTLRVDFGRQTYLGLKKFALRYKPEEEKQPEASANAENQAEGESATKASPTDEQATTQAEGESVTKANSTDEQTTTQAEGESVTKANSTDEQTTTQTEGESVTKANSTDEQATTQEENSAQNVTKEKK